MRTGLIHRFGALALLALSTFNLQLTTARAQGTAFTYQGRLNDAGGPATGLFNLQFGLYDAATSGSLQGAGVVTNTSVPVTNGLFTVTVDFGYGAFDGTGRWLEIAVQSADSTNFTTLAPRQALTAAPYAQYAAKAGSAIIANVANTATFVNNAAMASYANSAHSASIVPASGIQGTLSPSQLPAGLLTNGAADVTLSGAFAGDGSGLSSVTVAASAITGSLADNKLSANVALLSTANQTFAGTNNFAGFVIATNANNLINGTFIGTVTPSQLPPGILTNGARGVNLSGTFSGDGAGVTNVPGVVSWLPAHGTSVQAIANQGIIVTNNTAAVTIILPVNPSVGATFKIAGVGAGGWILAQNAGQQVLAGNLASSIGMNWVQRTPAGFGNWTSVASSADGTHLIAATSSSDGTIYLSSDSGVTWTPSGPDWVVYAQYWSSVASSADGKRLLATVGDTAGHWGYVWVSTNAGARWNATLGTSAWLTSACSADGTKMFVATVSGLLYSSADSGSSWTYTNTYAYITGLACSSDGTKLVACADGGGAGGYIYLNGNILQSAGLRKWSAVACSADGANLVATEKGGMIYTSSDGGANWYPQSQANSAGWTAVAASSDGSRILAAYNGPGFVVTSADSGSTWLQRGTNTQWTAVASSSDGSKLVAASSDGSLWTSAQGATTTSGTAGHLVGGYLSALELVYVGGGVFLPLSHEGVIRAY